MDFLTSEEAVANSTELISHEESYQQDGSMFLFSTTAQVIFIVTAVLSVSSSLLIMNHICRSQLKLTSSYHIIMFFMSFWDFITSMALAFSTVPMPSDIDKEVYPFAGKSYGTQFTCNVQGIMLAMGSFYVVFSNITLCIFYVCTIRCKMSEKNVKRRLLPIMLFTCSIIVIYAMVTTSGSIKPQVFPQACMGAGISIQSSEKPRLLQLVPILIFVMIALAMALLLGSPWLRDKFSRIIEIFNSSASDTSSGNDNDGASIQGTVTIEDERREYRRVVVRGAIMYIGAFFLTWFWPMILVTLGGRISTIFHVLGAIFFPLQGFFNALIFIYYKVYNVRRSHSEYSFREALLTVIKSPSSVPDLLLSRMEVLELQESSEHSKNDDENIEENLVSRRDEDIVGSDFDFSSRDTPSLDYSGALDCDVTLVGPNDVAMRKILEVRQKRVIMRRSGMNDNGQSG